MYVSALTTRLRVSSYAWRHPLWKPSWRSALVHGANHVFIMLINRFNQRSIQLTTDSNWAKNRRYATNCIKVFILITVEKLTKVWVTAIYAILNTITCWQTNLRKCLADLHLISQLIEENVYYTIF